MQACPEDRTRTYGRRVAFEDAQFLLWIRLAWKEIDAAERGKNIREAAEIQLQLNRVREGSNCGFGSNKLLTNAL